jgi:hypothetical protein
MKLQRNESTARLLAFVAACAGGLLSTSLAGAAVIPLTVTNPSFELLAGTDPTHFDGQGKLLPRHYAQFPGYPTLSIGFNTENAMPGWQWIAHPAFGAVTAGTANYQVPDYFAAGVPDGQNVAWINVAGTVTQTLADKFTADTVYRLSVDVGVVKGVAVPGYSIGLYANGQPVAVDQNSVQISPGGFQRVSVTAIVPVNSSIAGVPIEIRLGIPGISQEQVVFDNVTVTAQPRIVDLPVANPSFELLTGTDPGHFGAEGRLLPKHYAQFLGYPTLSIGFNAENAIPGWQALPHPAFGAMTAGTANYQVTDYFPSGVPDGQNVAWIDVAGAIGQTLTNDFEAGVSYRLTVNVGVPAGVAFPGYFIGLFAGGEPVAYDENSVAVPSGDFTEATVVARLEPGSPYVGKPIQIRLGIPGIGSHQVNFDHVRLKAESGGIAEPDTKAPTVALTEPVAGTVTDDRFNLRGTAMDNVAVTSVTWTWNGTPQGNLTLTDGQFVATGLTLQPGNNTFVVTANDAAGNQSSVTREVTLAALRTLRVGDVAAVQEGKRLSFPIFLESPGDVGGMTFRLTYDPAYLADPQVEWASGVGQSVNNVNLVTAGEISVSFALPGTALASGTVDVATISFRARSVPFALTTELSPRIESVSSATGAVLNRGNAVVVGAGQIKQRRLTADNNANQRLDIGDAVVVSRLQVGLEEARSWDVGLNDLNTSGNIDSGDIVRVLRAVVGLDPQPAPAGGVARQAIGRSAVAGDEVTLEFPEGQLATVGQPYPVVVRVTHLAGGLSGLSFMVDYPSTLTLSKRQVGALVPNGTLPLWNAGADFVQLAAVGPNAWPAAGGVAAVLTFVPEAGFSALAGWPIKLRQVELTGSGFDIRSVNDVNAIVKSVAIPPTPPAVTLRSQPDGGLALEVRAEAGFEFVVERSGELGGWSEETTATGLGVGEPVTINLAPDATSRFWRARNR